MFSKQDKLDVETLEELFEAGKVKGEFPSSLLRQYAIKEFLSEKQMFYVRKLITEAGGSGNAAKETGEIVNAEALQQLFRCALRADVQYPHISYPVDGTHDEQHIKAFLADNRRDIIFMSERTRVRYAWFDALNNKLHCTHNQVQPTTALYKQIRRILADPVAEAIVSGKLTNRCMFCSLELKNEFSVDHGYGPICAENYGLPWHAGKSSKTVQIDADDLIASLGGDEEGASK